MRVDAKTGISKRHAALFNRIIAEMRASPDFWDGFGPKKLGRPRKHFPPCPKPGYGGSHRYNPRTGRCPCGEKKEPLELVWRLMNAVRGEEEGRVRRAATILHVITQRLDEESRQAFDPNPRRQNS